MKAYEIYQNIKPSIIVDLFTWMRESNRDIYKNTVSTLANDRKLRPVFVQKKPLTEQIAWIHKTLKLKSSNAIGEHLFQMYFMQAQQDMLITFCDALEIPHDGKGSVESELPSSIDTEKLRTAINALLEKHDSQLVSLYLRIFNLQKVNGWDNLTDILEKDERLQFNT